MRHGRWIFGLSALFLLLSAMAAGTFYKWFIYYPRDIQLNVLDSEVVKYSNLRSFTPNVTGYGDALFVWKYEVPSENIGFFKSRCKMDDQGGCVISNSDSSTGESDVLILRGHMLEIQKWWF